MARSVKPVLWNVGLFSALGIFSFYLLQSHLEISDVSPDVAMYIGIMLAKVLVFNLFGFGLMFGSSWLIAGYSMPYARRWHLVVRYVVVALLLLLLNYLLLVVLKTLFGSGQDVFSVRLRGGLLLLAVWFVEMTICSLLLMIRSMQSVQQLRAEKQMLETDAVKARYAALPQQLDPHFLFNSLNTLIAEIEYEPSVAVSFTQHLSDVYRYILQSKDRETVSLREEMEFLDSYIYLQQVRSGGSLRLDVQIPDVYMDYHVPPLALQLLAENVLKHNHMSEREIMTIRLYTEGTEPVRLVMSNLVRPKKQQAVSTGKGLQNLAERYRLLCGGTVVVRNEGQFFSVSIPLLYEC